MTVQVNVYEAKSQLSQLLDRAANGERIVIARNGKPIVDLVPHVGGPVRIGGMKGELRYDDRSFEEADADVNAMFYGDDAAS